MEREEWRRGRLGQSVREPLVSFENECLSFLGRAPGSLRGSLVNAKCVLCYHISLGD